MFFVKIINTEVNSCLFCSYFLFINSLRILFRCYRFILCPSENGETLLLTNVCIEKVKWFLFWSKYVVRISASLPNHFLSQMVSFWVRTRNEIYCRNSVTKELLLWTPLTLISVGLICVRNILYFSSEVILQLWEYDAMKKSSYATFRTIKILFILYYLLWHPHHFE